jgi:DNA-binding NarL/FixJ family response regulator
MSTRTEPPIRVAVVEDQPLYRGMLVTLLGAQAGIDVVAEAAGAREARTAIAPGSVDVALLDIGLSDGNGIALGVSLRRADPDIGILLLSSQDAMEYLLDLPKDVLPRCGYLSKNSGTSPQILVEAIRATAHGQTVLDPALVGRARPRTGSRLAALSGRQYQVLQLVARGLSNQGVARELGISPRSVENHLGTVYSVLDLPDDMNPRVASVLRLIEESTRSQR